MIEYVANMKVDEFRSAFNEKFEMLREELARNTDVQKERNRLLAEQNSETMTREQVAKMLGVSEWTVDEYATKGLLIKYKLERRVIFLREEVMNYIKSNKVK